MKKAVLLAWILAAALLLTACGNVPPEKAIIGAWRVDKAEDQQGTDRMRESFDTVDEGGMVRFTFTDTGKWSLEVLDREGNVERSNEMDYSLKDGKLTMNGMDAGFELSGDSLKITDANGANVVTVFLTRMK